MLTAHFLPSALPERRRHGPTPVHAPAHPHALVERHPQPMDQEGLLHHAQTRVERHTKGRRVSSCPDAHSHPHGRAGRALDLLPSVGVGGTRDVTGDSIFFFFFRSRPKFFSRVAPPTPLA